MHFKLAANFLISAVALAGFPSRATWKQFWEILTKGTSFTKD